MRWLKPSRVLEYVPSGQVGSGEAWDLQKGWSSVLDTACSLLCSPLHARGRWVPPYCTGDQVWETYQQSTMETGKGNWCFDSANIWNYFILKKNIPIKVPSIQYSQTENRCNMCSIWNRLGNNSPKLNVDIFKQYNS